MNRNLNKIKGSGFKTPKNYFEEVEDSVLNQIKLSSIENTGFKTPKGYLDTLEDTVMAKVSENKDTKVIHLFSRKNLLYASSIAATILLLFNLSIFESNRTASFDTLDTATVENYIMNEYVSSYDMASLLTDEDIVEEDFIEHSFSEENIENYILNNIDIEYYFSE
ncbi:hypothetical protein KO566_06630 [Flavobacteriaceae bacterium XHP0103]|uniref:hypothetical protein n=1 Tax=Marixanthotalea marina TaxID=2844359 RepID=UPI002989A454|nr:hypothetical protein [Marixanthotalea marina]MBU3821730.1 hypothetical protein [Marixanthotalea marina]